MARMVCDLYSRMQQPVRDVFLFAFGRFTSITLQVLLWNFRPSTSSVPPTTIPPELLEEIIDYLWENKDVLVACSFVYRLFYLRTRVHIFHSTELKHTPNDKSSSKNVLPHIRKITNLDYNVPGSKLNRGMSVVDTTEITKGTSLTDDEYLKAAVLGWGTELLQALFLVSDDMMDSSITRRGQPC
ncbi:uncharacterized protein ARMOST_07616 [Armillaria ostoyae]|uniref:(2E,6E)-farnesyl diphosphate synthase n=1 Tax=Armillaria ostoyae TaxID=47428 RepID=A0A284R6B9_ARMOS|nr:uncharacterized protein ARMOST_07616 [Armillaria ostoyae]